MPPPVEYIAAQELLYGLYYYITLRYGNIVKYCAVVALGVPASRGRCTIPGSRLH